MHGDPLLERIFKYFSIVSVQFLLKSGKNAGKWSHMFVQGSHRLEKYFNIEGFLEKSLKIKSALKRSGKSLKKPWKVLEFYYFLLHWALLIKT